MCGIVEAGRRQRVVKGGGRVCCCAVVPPTLFRESYLLSFWKQLISEHSRSFHHHAFLAPVVVEVQGSWMIDGQHCVKVEQSIIISRRAAELLYLRLPEIH